MRDCWIPLLVLAGCAVPARAGDGTAVFENNCASCHGSDGRAQTPQGRKMKAHDLRDCRLTDAEIERQIRAGSKTKKGPAVMPAFGHDLTDAEIQALILKVKSFRPPPAGPDKAP